MYLLLYMLKLLSFVDRVIRDMQREVCVCSS